MIMSLSLCFHGPHQSQKTSKSWGEFGSSPYLFISMIPIRPNMRPVTNLLFLLWFCSLWRHYKVRSQRYSVGLQMGKTPSVLEGRDLIVSEKSGRLKKWAELSLWAKGWVSCCFSTGVNRHGPVNHSWPRHDPLECHHWMGGARRYFLLFILFFSIRKTDLSIGRGRWNNKPVPGDQKKTN